MRSGGEERKGCGGRPDQNVEAPHAHFYFEVNADRRQQLLVELFVGIPNKKCRLSDCLITNHHQLRRVDQCSQSVRTSSSE